MNIRKLLEEWRYRSAAHRFISSGASNGARTRILDAHGSSVDGEANARDKNDLFIKSIWELSAALKGDPAVDYLVGEQTHGFARHKRALNSALWAAAAATVLVCVSAYVFITPTTVSYATGIGEQKTVVLADGSSMFLNTATVARVEYRAFRRVVRLDAGEAAFDVAKNKLRPFEVITPVGFARAVGTQFDVLARPAAMEVSIVEGAVAVGPALTSPPGVVVHAGQLATIMPGTSVSVGLADIARIVEHRVERLEFDNAPLADVLAECNRYSRTPVRALTAAVSARKISGVFQAGDAASLAASIAASLQLRSIDTPDAIILAAEPGPNGAAN
jgi:transmembrane sensor